MPIFQVKNNKAQRISLKSYFHNEQELHDFFEANLEVLLGVRLLQHKYNTQGSGIPDTLAIDESNTPVVIEYKFVIDPGVLVQGLSYRGWLKDNKKHIELLAKDIIGADEKINWSNPRIILVAPGFDSRTKLAAKDSEDVELYKYTLYDQGFLYLETEYSSNPSKMKEPLLKKDEDEIYNLNYHLKDSNKEIKDIFYSLQEKMKLLPDVNEIVNQKVGITYRTTKSFTRFEFGKSYIDVLVRESKYNDPKGLVKDITSFKWGYQGKIKVTSLKEVDDVFALVKQSYEQTL